VPRDQQWVNQDRRARFGSQQLIAFMCECGTDGCSRTVRLTPRQYDTLHRDGAGVILDDAHRPPQAVPTDTPLLSSEPTAPLGSEAHVALPPSYDAGAPI
jgi:hypothetical protein